MLYPSGEHFKWPRGTHKDARCMPVEERPALPDVAPVEAIGKLIKQPGDGSCLYHSLSRGEWELGRRGTPHAELRRELAMWVKSNGPLPFNGKTVSAWLESELGRPMSVAAYAKQQSVDGWGGPLEILAFVLLKKVNVWVWVPLAQGRYRRTSCFNVPHGQKEVGTINISHIYYTAREAVTRGRGRSVLLPCFACPRPARKPPVHALCCRTFVSCRVPFGGIYIYIIYICVCSG